MADNLKYNEPGTGPLVATDDVGSIHYQIMKIDIGKPDGASIPIVGQIPVVINSGTVAIGPLPVSVSGTVHGMTAADLPASSFPIVFGAVAEVAGDAQPTNLVDNEGDVVRVSAGRDGALYTKPHPPRIWHYSQEFTSKMTDYVVKSGVANLSLYLGTIFFVASGVVNAFLKDGTAVTSNIKWKHYAGGLGDGVALQFNPPIKLSTNTDLSYTSTASIITFLSISGYTAP